MGQRGAAARAPPLARGHTAPPSGAARCADGRRGGREPVRELLSGYARPAPSRFRRTPSWFEADRPDHGSRRSGGRLLDSWLATREEALGRIPTVAGSPTNFGDHGPAMPHSARMFRPRMDAAFALSLHPLSYAEANFGVDEGLLEEGAGLGLVGNCDCCIDRGNMFHWGSFISRLIYIGIIEAFAGHLQPEVLGWIVRSRTPRGEFFHLLA